MYLVDYSGNYIFCSGCIICNSSLDNIVQVGVVALILCLQVCAFGFILFCFGRCFFFNEEFY